jgi:hypothetical protein
MVVLTGGSDITPITDLINTWIHIGHGLVGSIGALVFIFAFRVCHEYCRVARLGTSSLTASVTSMPGCL